MVKVGDKVAATGDIKYWHTVTATAIEVVDGKASKVLVDDDAVHEDGSACGYRGREIDSSGYLDVWLPIETAPAYPPELVERMVALVRRMAPKSGKGYDAMDGNDYYEAKEIAADLPFIDTALTEARKLAADFLLHGHGSEGVLDGALDHTPLLQTLVKAFKAGEAQ